MKSFNNKQNNFTTTFLETVTPNSSAGLTSSDSLSSFSQTGRQLVQAPADPYGFLLNRTNVRLREIDIQSTPITNTVEGEEIRNQILSTVEDSGGMTGEAIANRVIDRVNTEIFRNLEENSNFVFPSRILRRYKTYRFFTRL